jgi:hypothetical protein
VSDPQRARELADRAEAEADDTTSLPRHAYLSGVEDALRWVAGETAPEPLERLLDGEDDGRGAA